MIFRRDILRPVAAVLFCFLGLAGCEGGPDRLDPVEQARFEISRGFPEDARIILERQLSEGTDRVDLAALLGEAALQSGDLESAARWLGPGSFSDDTAALGWRMLGRLEMARGDLAAAGKAFDRSHAVAPDNPDLWVDIGRLRFLGGEQVEAVKAADRALALAPENKAALLFRGQLIREASGMVPAIEWFERALDLHPDDLDLRLEYSATLGDAGRAADALAVLREGGEGVVLSETGLYLQAVIAARGGKFLLARELLQRSGLETEGVPAALMLSAIVDLQNANPASAAQTLDRLLLDQPDNVRAVELLAAALLQSGSERELVYRFADRALGPAGSPHLRLLVGRAHEALEQRARAAQFIDLAALGPDGLAPLPSDTPTETLTATGGGGAQTRDFVRSVLFGQARGSAVGSAEDFVRRFPGSADGYAILGDAELASGDRRAARDAYVRAADIRQPWPLTLRLAGSQATPEATAELLAEYLQANPMNGHAAALLADAYAAQGKWRTAATLLDHAMAHGQSRVPWVLASRGIVAGQLGDADAALDFAFRAHELQPLNPRAIAALIETLPPEQDAARADLQAKLTSLLAS